MRDGKETILMGDFNYDYTKKVSLSSPIKNFQRIISLFGLQQLIK